MQLQLGVLGNCLPIPCVSNRTHLTLSASQSVPLAVSCPNANGVICSGHGRCVTEGAAAAGTQDAVYTAWDAYQTTGCICDKGFTGYNCALQQCILGNDPYNHGTLEVQSITTSVTYQADTHFIKLDGASDVNQVLALTSLLIP